MTKMLGGFARVCVAAALSFVIAQGVRADQYAIVVGSYGDQSNAERARVSAETHLRQRGINASVRLLPASGGTRVAVMATTQNRQRLLQQLRQDKYPDAWRMALVTQAPPPVDQVTHRKPAVGPELVQQASPVPKASAVQPLAPPQPVKKSQPKKKPQLIAQPMQADARLKGFALAADLPGSDWQRTQLANPTADASGDLRVMLNKTVGPMQFQLHHSTVLQAGDAVQWGQTGMGQIDQVSAADDGRLLDMAWQTDAGARHQWSHRI